MNNLYFLLLNLLISSYGMANYLFELEDPTALGVYLEQIRGSEKNYGEILKRYFPHGDNINASDLQYIYKKIQKAALITGYEDNLREFLREVVFHYGGSFNIFEAIDRLEADFEKRNLPEYLKQDVSIIHKLLFFYGFHKKDIIFYISMSIYNLNPRGVQLEHLDYLSGVLLSRINSQNNWLWNCQSLKECLPFTNDILNEASNYSRSRGMDNILSFLNSLDISHTHPHILNALKNIKGIYDFEEMVTELFLNKDEIKGIEEIKLNSKNFEEIVKKISEYEYETVETPNKIITIEDPEIRLEVLKIFYTYLNTEELIDSVKTFKNDLLKLQKRLIDNVDRQEFLSFERDLSIYIVEHLHQPSPKSGREHQDILKKISNLLMAVLKMQHRNNP